MKRSFGTDGIRISYSNYDKINFDRLKADWKKFAENIEDYPDNFSGRGIVFCAGGLRYFTCCYIAITRLRKLGCTLPIEVWYLGNELSKEAVAELQKLSVTCKDFYDYNYESIPLYKYILKPLAILKSSFKEVLFLDADNICVRDPSYLFDCPEFKTIGSLFWPDYWKTASNNPIWNLVDSKEYETPEFESGQLIVNKQKCWRELNLCWYFNLQSKFYYEFLHGDKDTFKFAWLALRSEFYLITREAGVCGYFDLRNTFLGNTIVQFGPDDEILFLHRNQLKWDVILPGEKIWESIKTFKKGALNKEYDLYDSYNGNTVMDIKGDIDCMGFTETFGDLEGECLFDLEHLRGTDFFTRFMKHSYLVDHRFANNVYFSLHE